jgi:hypothetical protein
VPQASWLKGKCCEQGSEARLSACEAEPSDGLQPIEHRCAMRRPGGPRLCRSAVSEIGVPNGVLQGKKRTWMLPRESVSRKARRAEPSKPRPTAWAKGRGASQEP